MYFANKLSLDGYECSHLVRSALSVFAFWTTLGLYSPRAISSALSPPTIARKWRLNWSVIFFNLSRDLRFKLLRKFQHGASKSGLPQPAAPPIFWRPSY